MHLLHPLKPHHQSHSDLIIWFPEQDLEWILELKCTPRLPGDHCDDVEPRICATVRVRRKMLERKLAAHNGAPRSINQNTTGNKLNMSFGRTGHLKLQQTCTVMMNYLIHWSWTSGTKSLAVSVTRQTSKMETFPFSYTTTSKRDTCYCDAWHVDIEFKAWTWYTEDVTVALTVAVSSLNFARPPSVFALQNIQNC